MRRRQLRKDLLEVRQLISYVATWETVLPKETPDSTDTEGRSMPARPEDSKETQIRGVEGMSQIVVEGEV